MALRNGMSFMGLWLPKVSEHRWEIEAKDGHHRAPGVIVHRLVPGIWKVNIYFERASLTAEGPTKRAAIEKMRRYIRELDEQLVYFRYIRELDEQLVYFRPEE